MISFVRSWLPGIPEWLMFEMNPVDSLLQGFVGACGISILRSLLRVHLFLKANSDNDERKNKEQSGTKKGTTGGLIGSIQFWLLTGLLSLVGPRVSSLVALEFCLRAVSARITVEADVLSNYIQQHLVQCQFSLGCALTCSLHFLQEGALHSWLSLLLAVGPSWILASQSERLLYHVVALYPLHSSNGYCGVCITLLASGRTLLPHLCHAVVLAFSVAAVAGVSIVNHHFLSGTEALRFWTLLTICYALLVVYIQEEQHRHPGGEAMLHTVVVRLGGLLVLMLTVGNWTDVLHILICFLGEVVCLVPSQDLLDGIPEEDDDGVLSEPPQKWRKDSRWTMDSRPETQPDVAIPPQQRLRASRALYVGRDSQNFLD
ncbi:hypothetical protein AGOR_G00157290 [Albula goreensis]|uniref:Transmembrane protein 82 n=1 Tax=Albula goreensis TaxID=1534307 RepID=A0A8T3D815_9TELE|nr:hypothetical protein AGOR_G00157290 [Albula goreensis]